MNKGSHQAMAPFDSKLRKLSPQPYWKMRIMSP